MALEFGFVDLGHYNFSSTQYANFATQMLAMLKGGMKTPRNPSTDFQLLLTGDRSIQIVGS